MRQFWITREIDAPADDLWRLLVSPDEWPRWGPTVRSAEVDGGRLSSGSVGTVTTIVGLDLPFEVTDLDEGRHWTWKVAGVPATDHTVEPLEPGRCRVGFGVPWPAWPYLAVCAAALRRLDRLATAAGGWDDRRADRRDAPGCGPMISTEMPCTATAPTVHELLVDVDAWSVWSPHVASVAAQERRVATGWTGATRAFFAPGATPMIVDQVVPDGGYRWHSELGPWRLDYENRVEPAEAGSVLRFSARLSGPGATWIERLVAPVSAYGQRRRMARLVRLAELIERSAR